MTMAMASFRIVFRHILHTNTYNRFFPPPTRATWRRCLLSSRTFSTNSTNYNNYSVVVKKDERLGEQTENENSDVVNSTTIAAIVTSLGGPPAAVGIVRLSGPHAVSIAGRVFRPSVRNTWQPTSHVVEYGVVLDSDGNVIDEVSLLVIIEFGNGNVIC
jgi:tRNA modification GTPase